MNVLFVNEILWIFSSVTFLMKNTLRLWKPSKEDFQWLCSMEMSWRVTLSILSKENKEFSNSTLQSVNVRPCMIR